MTEIRKEEENNDYIRRENIIISSILYGSAKNEAVEQEINEDFFEKPMNKKIIQHFNAVSQVMEPTEDAIIDQFMLPIKKDYTEEEAVAYRVRFVESFKKLREEYPPENWQTVQLHIDVLRKKYSLDKYEKIVEGILEHIKTSKALIDDPLKDQIAVIKQFIEEQFFGIDNDTIINEMKSMDIVDGIMYAIQKAKEALNQDENQERVTTGYEEIDKIFAGGWNKGNFSVIAGRPAMGKTVMMLNLALESARRGVKVLFLSIEMTLLQCFQRCLSRVTGVSSEKIQQPKTMNESDWEQLSTKAEEMVEIYDNTLWIEEVSQLTPAMLERKIRYYKKNNNIDLVFVDYAQIMQTNGGRTPREVADYNEISGSLRSIAKDMNVAIVVGSQVSRDVDKRPDKRPTQSDLKNSGAFEQDAAQVICLYRDEVYTKEECLEPNILEFIICKNRFGKGEGTIKLNCDYTKQSIFSMGQPVPMSA